MSKSEKGKEPSTTTAEGAEEKTFPDMKLQQLKFLAQSGIDKQKNLQEMLKEIELNDMTSFYLQLVEDKVIEKKDEQLLKKMQQKNADELKKLNDKLEDVTKNFGETEVFDALLAIANFHTRTGSKSEALEAQRAAYEKAVGAGAKLDIVFCQLRLGLFYMDHDLIGRQLERAQQLIDEGGDWDRRNRLKVYRGIYLLSIRDFKQATPLLLDGLPTFTSSELMPYKDFVRYTVLASLLTVERSELKKKVIDSPEILEVLHEIAHLEDYLTSLYQCKYGQFFRSLAAVEAYLKHDRYLSQHQHWYVREMRILAYRQILESYRSLTLESMARHFGVTQEFIDADLCRFIAAGRLPCVIDKVSGLVESNRPDTKNAQYQQCIKQGDLLLNRIQKLGRVINV